MKQKLIFTCTLVFLLSSCTNQSKNRIRIDNCRDKQITFHEDRVVIFLSPTENERKEVEESMSEEDLDIFTDDAEYYNAMAMKYIFDENEKVRKDTINSIGFIIARKDTINSIGFIIAKKDTIVLNKDDFQKTLWNIVLFDGKTTPLVVAPIEIQEAYNEYFNIKKEDDN